MCRLPMMPLNRPLSCPTATLPAAACPIKRSMLIDEAGARVHLKSMTRPPDLKEIDEEVERLNKEKEEAVCQSRF